MLQNLSSTEITELVCTRISHDLIGNIGAVANAVELMEDNDPDILNEVKTILDASSQTLTARLKIFRLAFGLSNTSIKSVDEIKQLCTNYLATIGSRSTPINLDFSLNTPELYKFVLLGTITLADVFVRGGRLAIMEDKSGLKLEATSPSPLAGAKLAVMQNVLDGKFPLDNPSQSAPIIYMQSLLNHTAVKIKLVFDNTAAALTIA